MRSDNGTNFIGGNKELSSAISQWNVQKIHGFFLQKHIKWIFNPPSGSHHGGLWEHCIRTVRKVLNAVLKEQALDYEGLSTLMCEVEAIVNSRLITKSSDDPKDCEALTPNHYSSFDQVRAYLLVHSVRKTNIPGGDGDNFSISLKYSG